MINSATRQSNLPLAFLDCFASVEMTNAALSACPARFASRLQLAAPDAEYERLDRVIKACPATSGHGEEYNGRTRQTKTDFSRSCRPLPALFSVFLRVHALRYRCDSLAAWNSESAHCSNCQICPEHCSQRAAVCRGPSLSDLLRRIGRGCLPGHWALHPNRCGRDRDRNAGHCPPFPVAVRIFLDSSRIRVRLAVAAAMRCHLFQGRRPLFDRSNHRQGVLNPIVFTRAGAAPKSALASRLPESARVRLPSSSE